jgi:hypothetical protein
MRELILDMDSSVSETYGEQEGTAYNGHFGCTCYHPLFCFNQFGDVERALLREGNVHSAKDWRAVLEPVVARYQGRNLRRYFRADAAFANPEVYKYLEAEDFEYAIRLPGNDALVRDIAGEYWKPRRRCLHIREKRGIGAKKGIGTSPVPAKNQDWTGKRACKPAAREENHEKVPRWSWTGNQMGNPRLDGQGFLVSRRCCLKAIGL